MSAGQQFEDEWLIRRALERYCRAVDDSDFGSVAELFSEDAVLEFGGEVLVGRELIRSYYDGIHGAERAPVTGVHLLGNCIVDITGDEASASTDFVHVWRVGEGGGADAAAILGGEHLAQIPVAGRYLDRLRRVDGAWLITRRGADLFATSPRSAGGGRSTRRPVKGHIRMRTTVQVREGCVEKFERLMSHATADSLTEVADPTSGVLGYSAYLDRTSRIAVLYEHHADPASLSAHLAVDPDRRADLRQLCDQLGPTEIYGESPTELLETLAGLGIDLRVYPASFGELGEL